MLSGAVALRQVLDALQQGIRRGGLGYYLAQESVGLVRIDLQAAGKVDDAIGILDAGHDATALGEEIGAVTTQRHAAQQWHEQVGDVGGSIERCGASGDEFEALIKSAAKEAEVTLNAPLRRAILSALAERDETAPPCTDSDGNPEADSDLRDHERVPLTEDVEDVEPGDLEE